MLTKSLQALNKHEDIKREREYMDKTFIIDLICKL